MTEETVTIRSKIKQLRDLRYTQESADFSDLSDGLNECDDFKALCLELAEEAVEREHQAEAVEARIKELQSRKQRLLHSAEALRTIVLQCMDIRSEKTIPSPCLTLSVSSKKPDIVVTDESALPSRFFIPQPPKLDKKAVREAVLQDGEVLEGVSLGNGTISLTIRRK
ncbi:siphovirus Gp157 family protein [Limnoglobus roseus]|uniref:Siphovirus Gp157 family protein n=1 Tax=Limnoglobus roseus TaxID=2598579 RepID=A0A5C1AMG2_9BACT|nr:siphovirus Gp157 family protein [Limnoglobus roseus]QEL19317.1 hypothetical protein PX52LOC_06383 [Limnoglobus roseus]